MNIRILYTEGCPNLERTYTLLLSCLRELGINEPIRRIEVHSPDEAMRYHFLGSPSIQIDGKDIEFGASGGPPLYGCRLYTSEGRLTGVPEKNLIIRSLVDTLDNA
jgi:hypothetical protein